MAAGAPGRGLRGSGWLAGQSSRARGRPQGHMRAVHVVPGVLSVCLGLRFQRTERLDGPPKPGAPHGCELGRGGGGGG